MLRCIIDGFISIILKITELIESWNLNYDLILIRQTCVRTVSSF